MATIAKLAASRRTQIGTTASRRLRREGLVPANVYGHQQDPLAVAVRADDLRAVVASGAHVVDLDVEGTAEKALIREVQWDTFSTYIQHLDFLRVDPNERVQVAVPVHLKGTAAGVIAGGMLEHHLHALEIECPAIEVPDAIDIRISDLEIGGAIHVSDIPDLPANLTVLDSADSLVVQIVKPGAAVEEEEAAEFSAAEPELIGRGGEDKESDD